MKVKETTQANPLSRTAKVERVTQPAREDRVSLDAAQRVREAIVRSRQSEAGARTARLESLKAEVKAGRYQPDPHRIADRILEDAQLEAQLRALLEREG